MDNKTEERIKAFIFELMNEYLPYGTLVGTAKRIAWRFNHPGGFMFEDSCHEGCAESILVALLKKERKE